MASHRARMIFRVSVSALVLFAVSTCTSRGTAQFDSFQQVVAEIDAELAAGVAEDGMGCLMIAIFVGDQIVVEKAYGWADMERGVTATPNTIGRVGSITKSLTAIVAMQLVEHGLIDWDDAVIDHVPELERLMDRPADTDPITFRMLASHTSGLRREPALRDAATGSIYRWEDKLIESIAATSFQSRPNTEYSYSNIGVGILGFAASRVADRSFIELVDDQILQPLSMTSSGFIVTDPDQKQRLAIGYFRDRDGVVNRLISDQEQFGRGYKVPNGGLYATVGDLARLSAAMMDEGPVAILSAASTDQMLTPQAPATAYGLGFTIQQGDDRTIVGHGGSIAGYNADWRFDRQSKVGIAVLRTTGFRPPSAEHLNRLIDANSQSSDIR